MGVQALGQLISIAAGKGGIGPAKNYLKEHQAFFESYVDRNIVIHMEVLKPAGFCHLAHS